MIEIVALSFSFRNTPWGINDVSNEKIFNSLASMS